MCECVIFILLRRKECKFVHDFYSPHNHSVLRQHGLDSTFSNDELRQLLLQNDPTLLPEVSAV